MYSPKIQPKQVMALYLLKQKTRKPITKMVREAIDEYLAKHEEEEDEEKSERRDD